MKTSLSLLLILFSLSLQAQFTYTLEQNVEVEGDKTTLSMPWVGGLNAAQYNTMDLNEDGREDLVLFDRMADKIFPFLNQSDHYQFAPEYASFFPNEVTNWLLLRDYNGDGRKDIFTGDILGIKVFTNVTQPGEPLAWKHLLFYAGPTGSKSSVVLTKGFSAQKINLQMQYDDLPALMDADGDGDLDIFSISFAGNGTIEYHKNFSMERYATSDSLDFERITNKWGGITECTCGNFAFNNADCNTSGGRLEHAGGKSLLLLDVTHDGELDALFSEATCTRLSLLENEGDLLNPVINANVDFPNTSPVSFIYPAAYYEDVDFDGVKDLISTPNIFTKTFLSTNLAMSNWFYKNTGSNASPTFTFGKYNFLQDQMIDVGDNAVPAFMDYDADGDYDLFISQNTSEVTSGTVQVYENTGSPTEPKFKLVENNLLGFTLMAFYNIKIQFADINNDRKNDLVFTASGLFDGQTRLYYLPGKSSTSFDFSLGDLQTISLPGYSIASTENVLVTDVNLDGRNDIILGRSNGALNYWRSTGPLAFILEDDTYLGIGSSVLRQNLACAVGDLDNNGTSDLVIGDQTGQLRIVSDFRKASSADDATSSIVWNSISETYEAYNLGGRVWPTVVNLFGASKPSIVTGNILGGVSILRNNNEGELPEAPVIRIYPNPVAKNDALQVTVDRSAEVQVFSMTGQSVSAQEFVPANQVSEIKTYNLATGVYILRFIIGNKSFAKKFVVY